MNTEAPYPPSGLLLLCGLRIARLDCRFTLNVTIVNTAEDVCGGQDFSHFLDMVHIRHSLTSLCSFRLNTSLCVRVATHPEIATSIGEWCPSFRATSPGKRSCLFVIVCQKFSFYSSSPQHLLVCYCSDTEP